MRSTPKRSDNSNPRCARWRMTATCGVWCCAAPATKRSSPAATRADILVENNRPAVMQRLGLDYPALKLVNPNLIHASISGLGQTLQRAPGLRRGHPGDVRHDEPYRRAGPAPSRVGASIGDMTASLFAAVGILPALQERHRTGRGLRRRSDARRSWLA
jgi:hypothetical protein